MFNYLNYETNQIIVECNLDLDVKPIIKKIIDLRKQFPISEISTLHAWHRRFFDINQGKSLQDFEDVLFAIENKTDELVRDLSSKYLKIGVEFKNKCVSAWAAIYDNRTLTSFHHHWPSSFGAIYYPHVKNPSKIIFHTVKQNHVVKIEVVPKINSLLIFQGHIPHEVECMGSEHDERIIIAANIMMYNDKIINYFLNN